MHTSKPAQFITVNLIKAVAAQFIILHHLAFYGPMSDYANPIMPAFIDWLDKYGRIAVQAFLVVGGFLAAKSLSSSAVSGITDPLGRVWRRYVKLAPPFIVAIVLAVGASAWAGLWMTHESISAPPDMLQFTAHALLLHDVLDHEALSAGAWYVAIDFQLYGLTIALLWLGGRLAGGRARPWLMPAMVAVGVCVSLFYFNRDAGWDIWAPYFFGSYGLGILAWWASDPARNRGGAALLAGLILVPTLFALMLDFRSRIAVALVVACLLVFLGRTRMAHSGRGLALIDWMANRSYAIFLIHFPVCLLVNAAFVRFVPPVALWQALGMVVAWALSVLAGAVFFRWVELPLGRLARDIRPPPSRPAGSPRRLSDLDLAPVVVSVAT